MEPPVAVTLGDVGTVAAVVVGLVTAAGGVYTYWVQTRERRGRWLMDLQQRFASEPAFQNVRHELYNGERSALVAALKHKKQIAGGGAEPLTDAEQRLLVQLDDYLDFLSLVQRLVASKELKLDDAYDLFSWYTLSGLQVPSVIEEVHRNFKLILALQEDFKEVYRKREGREWTPAPRPQPTQST